MTEIIKPKEARDVCLEVQAEYMGLCEIEPFDVEEKLYKGKLIETSRVGRWSKITDRDLVIFSRDYDPDVNDMDKIFKETKINDNLLGYEFVMIPLNKVRMFYTPASSVIKLVNTSGKVQS